MADDLIMEEREAAMASPTGGDVVVGKGHFLTPSVATTSPAAKELPLKITYQGWKKPPEKWRSWVDQLYPTHHSTWEKAGILGPILASKCNIHRHEGLIMNLVGKYWCPRTNSFLFPWGEATITLEDMMMIGGYSMLGEPVFKASEDEEIDEMIEKLVSARLDLQRSHWRTADRSKWMDIFMASGSEIEHLAFLAYWLSKFIFPFTRSTITTNVFPIAARLARGTPVALGPSILANIYKTLTLLKVSATKSELGNVVLHVTTSAPLSLFQVWIWERFPLLRPRPESVGEGPRLASWDNLKSDSKNSSLAIDSAGKDFQWRPYKTDWELVDSGLVGFARCVRTSELVSLEETCIEQYLPHRVALQFGMDQDIPGDVARVNSNQEIVWRHYIRPIRDAKLYVPPRDSRPRVTTRYLAWWKKVREAEASSEQKVVKKRKRPLSTSKSCGKFAARSDYSKSAPPVGRKSSLKRRRKNVVLSSSEESDDSFLLVRKVKASHSSMRTRVEEEATHKASIESDENVQSQDDTKERTNHSFKPTTNGNEESERIEAPTEEKNSATRNDEENDRVEARMDVKSASPSQVPGSELDRKIESLEERIVVIEKLMAFIKAGKIVCPP